MLSRLRHGSTSDDLAALNQIALPGVQQQDLQQDSLQQDRRRRLRQKTPGVGAWRPCAANALKRPATSMRPDVSKFVCARQFVRGAVSCLTADFKNRLALALLELQQLKHIEDPSADFTIRIGTACSGSELFLSSLRHLSHAVKKELGMSINFHHVWSFEKSHMKREFIESNWKPTFLFSDVTDIADGSTYEYVKGKKGKKVRVEKVDWLISGFSCRDASRLNQYHKERLNVVAESSHSTGSTIAGVCALVKLASPSRVFLENVPGLKDRPPMREGEDDPPQSNFECVAERLCGLGYSFNHSELNA